MIRTYEAKEQGIRCVVTMTPTAFKFSVRARDLAQLHDIHWMRVHTDDDERLVVFEPVPGIEKRPGLLKLGTSSKRHKTLTAKGLINSTPWIKAVSLLEHVESRKFDMEEYSGPLPKGVRGKKPWFIRLMPAFEESVVPSRVGDLGPDKKGIYRYLSDGEVVYIGKGNIRNRYQEEPNRPSWRVSRIEYSVIKDDEDGQKAMEWESWWIERFKEQNNGHRPRYNLNDGVRSP